MCYRIVLLSMLNCSILCLRAEYSMNWLGKDVQFSVNYSDGDTGYSITYKKALPDDLPQEVQKQFVPLEMKGVMLWRFRYGAPFEPGPFVSLCDTDRKSPNNPDNTPDNTMDASYHVGCSPLVVKDESVPKVFLDAMVSLLKDKRIAWYTGAGLSCSIVPDMALLEKMLGLQKREGKPNFTEFVVRCVYDSKAIHTVMQNFFFTVS